jgi:guanosine-3',5'-bis(diphosphate) 3'-pyrophosphohydrolase
MVEEEQFDLIWRSLAFSARQHRDQRRKDIHQSPYINHPIQVAEVLWRVGGVRDVITLSAALLHDTIEDTGATIEEITDQFGAEVCTVVLEVTDNKSLPKSDRKRLQVEHASHLSVRATLVKLADKICNVRDVGQNPPPNWTQQRCLEYLDWAASVVSQMNGDFPELKALFEHEVSGSRALLLKSDAPKIS